MRLVRSVHTLRCRFDRLLTVGALGLLLWAGWMFVRMVWPPPSWIPPAVDSADKGADEEHVAARMGLAELAVIWQRDLRQPVFERPEKPAEKPAEPKLAVELVGTAVEAEHRYAFFRMPDNKTVIKSVGEVVDAFEVVAIERGRARLRNGEREYELTVPRYDQLKMAWGD